MSCPTTLISASILSTLAAFSTPAAAGPLNPWGAATGEDTAMINPFLYVYGSQLQILMYGSAGLHERFDVFVGAGGFFPAGVDEATSLELFPRFFVIEQLAVVGHVYWTPGTDGVIVAPEVHFNMGVDRFALTANVGWRPVISTYAPSGGSIVLLVAPEFYVLPDRLSVFLEVDPTFPLTGDEVELVFVPGLGASLDADAAHTLSFGVQIPALPEVEGASFGMWYAYTFPTKSAAP